MDARPIRVGLMLTLASGSVAWGQSGIGRPMEYTPVGQLQDIGIVGRSDVNYGFGRLGGIYTGRLDPRYSNPVQLRRDAAGGGMYSGAGGDDRRLLSLSQSGRNGMFGQSQPGTSRFQFQPARRERLGTHSSNRERSFFTRSDLLRFDLPERVRFTGPLSERRRDALESVESPVRKLLDRQNPVRARSPLSRLATQFVGRSPISSDNLNLDAHPAPPVPDEAALLDPSATDDLVRLPDILAARLEDESVQKFRHGVAYFADAEYGRAWDHFEICANLNPRQALPRAAMTLTAYARHDYHLAAINLHRALSKWEASKSDSLDDLQIDVAAFYGSVQAFDRIVHEVNISANREGGEPSGDAFALLAYFAWLSQDLNTAIASARIAEGRLADPQGIRAFRERLMALQ